MRSLARRQVLPLIVAGAVLALTLSALAWAGSSTRVRFTLWQVSGPGYRQIVMPGGTFRYCAARRGELLEAFFRMKGPNHVRVREVWSLNGRVQRTFIDDDLSEVGPVPAGGPVNYGKEKGLANGVWSVRVERNGRVIGEGSITLAARSCGAGRGYGYTKSKPKPRTGGCFGCVTLTSWTIRAYPALGQDVGNCADVAPLTVPGPGRVIGPNVTGRARTWWIRWTFSTGCPYDFSTLVRISAGSPPIAIREVDWVDANGAEHVTTGPNAGCVNFSGSSITATVAFDVPNGNIYNGPLVVDQYLGAPSGSCA